RRLTTKFASNVAGICPERVIPRRGIKPLTGVGAADCCLSRRNATASRRPEHGFICRAQSAEGARIFRHGTPRSSLVVEGDCISAHEHGPGDKRRAARKSEGSSSHATQANERGPECNSNSFVLGAQRDPAWVQSDFVPDYQ